VRIVSLLPVKGAGGDAADANVVSHGMKADADDRPTPPVDTKALAADGTTLSD
jgi:hypothetical protein